MKKLVGTMIVTAGLAGLVLLDLASLGFVPDAEAIAGVRRRTARRTAVVVEGTSAAAVSSANAQAAAAEQEAAEANAEAAAAQQQAAAAQQQAAAAQQQPAPAATPMITTLPAGCVNTGQVYQCGDVYYKPYLQGTQVVYAQVPAP